MHYPTVEQTGFYDCGATSLFMIHKYFKGTKTRDQIKRQINAKKEGTSFLELANAAKTLGLEAIGFHTTTDELLKKSPVPFIAHVCIEKIYYHYVVVYKIKKNKLLIADPKDGTLEWRKARDFDKIFEGNIMTFYGPKETHKDKIKVFKPLFSILKKCKKLMISFFIIANLTLFLDLLFATSFYLLIKILEKQNIHLLYLSFLSLFILFKMKNFFLKKRDDIASQIEVKLSSYLKQARWNDIFSLSYQDLLYQEEGEISFKLEKTERIVSFYHNVLCFFVSDFLIFFLLLGFLISSQRTHFLVFPFLIYFFFLLKILTKEKSIIYKYRENICLLKKKEEELIPFLTEIKNQNLEKAILNKLKINYEEIQKKLLKLTKSFLNLSKQKNDINDFLTLIVQMVFIYLLQIQKVPLEQIFIMYSFFHMIKDSLNNLSALLLEKEKVKYDLDFFEKREEKEDPMIHSIEFKNARMKEIHLNNLCVSFKKGDSVLLVGKSGIGKSSFAHALKGDVEVENRFVNKREEKDLKRVCYVSNHAMIFEESILDNIMLNRQMDEKVKNEILNLTHVQPLLEKKYTFSYKKTLSSGERQKISLARALTTEFDVLILDEALNQLDEEEEKNIVRDLLAFYPDKIILVITHRSNLNDLFSKIITITNQGQIKRKRKKYV